MLCNINQGTSLLLYHNPLTMIYVIKQMLTLNCSDEFGNYMNIRFAGREGLIKLSSPHGNFLIVELSDRITICGTFSNKWNWEESQEIQSGFESFITYIGLESESVVSKWRKLAIALGGYFKYDDEDIPRMAKRVDAFPLEIKVRGLSADAVLELLQD